MEAVKKLLMLAVSGTTSLIIAACYGVGGMYDDLTLLIRAKDQAGEPIPGLQVSALCNEAVHEVVLTNEFGEGYLGFAQGQDIGQCNAMVEDVDGEENGEFQSQEVPLMAEVTEYDVTMEPVVTE